MGKREKPWKKLYADKRWCHPVHGRRAVQLRKQPLCEFCLKMLPPRFTPADVADHVQRHEGDPIKFFHGELASLCKPHHDGEKQVIECKGFSDQIGPDGFPLDVENHPFYK